MAIYNKSTSFSVDTPSWSATGKEPKASLKRTGFTAGFKPPAAYFNWFWNRVCRNLSDIKSKISDIWSFFSDTRFIIIEDIGSFNETFNLDRLYQGRYSEHYQKTDYFLTFTAVDDLAEDLNITSGTKCEVTKRYGDIRVYIPSNNKTYVLNKVGASNYYWQELSLITGDKIGEGSITADHLSYELREQLGI